MENVDSGVALIDYDKLKSLVAVHQVLNNYEYGVKDAIDAFINLSPEYINKSTTRKWLFFLSTDLTVNTGGAVFYSINRQSVKTVTASIKKLYTTHKDHYKRTLEINKVIESHFNSFSEYILVRDILNGLINWDELDSVMFASAAKSYIKRSMKSKSRKFSQSNSKYNFDSYDESFDFWDMYFMLELIEYGDIGYEYIDETPYMDEYVVDEVPYMGTHDMEVNPAFESAVIDTELDSDSDSDQFDSLGFSEPEPERFSGYASYDSDSSDSSDSSYDSGSDDCGGDD